MKWLSVGQSVVPFGETTQYILINEANTSKPVRFFPTLIELAKAVRSTLSSSSDNETRFIKNDVPAVLWQPDDTLADRVLECGRLEKNQLHELTSLLRRY